MPPLAVADARALTRVANAKRNSAYPKRAVSRRRTCSRTEFNPLFGEDRTKQRIERAVGPTFLRSGACGLSVPAALCAASREPSRGSGGPATAARRLLRGVGQPSRGRVCSTLRSPGIGERGGRRRVVLP